MKGVKCRNCGEPIRRIEPGEGYDLREYQWTHDSGGLLCPMDPPYAEPEDDPAPLDLLAAQVKPARLSAELTLDDGSVIQIPRDSGVVADGPASGGQITVRVPGASVPLGRFVTHVVIRSDSPLPEGSQFGADIVPALLVPPDGWLHVRIGPF